MQTIDLFVENVELRRGLSSYSEVQQKTLVNQVNYRPGVVGQIRGRALGTGGLTSSRISFRQPTRYIDSDRIGEPCRTDCIC